MAAGAPAVPAGLAEAARARGEWRPWVRLLDAARLAARDRAWTDAVPATPGGGGGQPLLAGAALTLDARALRRWLRALLAATDGAAPPGLAATRNDPARLAAILESALDEDGERLTAIADEVDGDAAALGALAGVAVMPLLRACAAGWGDRIPAAWAHGFCPVCGAWAALAEVRGLERERRLRCLRCAADWATPWLRCPFCGNDDHLRLGALVPAAEAGAARPAPAAASVDTCAACHGFLKSVTTLGPTPADDLGLLDLATVDLDAAAVAQGYRRPPGPGARLGARITIGGASRRWWPA